MAKGDLYLGVDVASLILLTPFGRTFLIGNTKLSRRARVSSGKLCEDIIATKKTFTLSYSEIDGDKLAEYDDLYDENSELLFRYYTDVSTYTDYTVLIDAIDKERLVLIDVGLWSGVEIKLVEV